MPPAKQSAESLVRGVREVASPPEIYSQINEALENRHCSIAMIAEIISQDPGLASKLLQLANSAFIGFAQQVGTVTRAVTLLGITQVRDLALATSVVRLFRDIPEDTVSMKSFWMHSIACGMLARLIAAQHHHREVERFFVAGVLHDLGRLLLLSKEPEKMRQAMALSEADGISLVEAELRVFGFSHTEVGEALLKQWQLPAALIEPVRFHHQPTRSVAHEAETRIIHISDLLVHALEIGASGEGKVPVLSKAAWAKLELGTEELEPLLLQTESEVELITGALLS